MAEPWPEAKGGEYKVADGSSKELISEAIGGLSAWATYQSPEPEAERPTIHPALGREFFANRFPDLEEAPDDKIVGIFETLPGLLDQAAQAGVISQKFDAAKHLRRLNLYLQGYRPAQIAETEGHDNGGGVVVARKCLASFLVKHFSEEELVSGELTENLFEPGSDLVKSLLQIKPKENADEKLILKHVQRFWKDFAPAVSHRDFSTEETLLLARLFPAAIAINMKAFKKRDQNVSLKNARRLGLYFAGYNTEEIIGMERRREKKVTRLELLDLRASFAYKVKQDIEPAVLAEGVKEAYKRAISVDPSLLEESDIDIEELAEKLVTKPEPVRYEDRDGVRYAVYAV